MLTTLRVLIVEDAEDDAALLLRELRRGPWEVTYERVQTADAMSAALDKHEWDLVIADYSMPNFSGPAALALAIGRVRDLPFILISGVVSEETAVLAMKAGADDYLSKWKLSRLVPAVERELHKAEGRRESRRLEQQLRASEGRYRTLFEYAPDGLVIANPDNHYIDVNPSICRMLGYSREELIGLHASNIVAPTEIPYIAQPLKVTNAESDYNRELQFRRKDGSVFAAEVIATRMPDGNLLGMIRDVTERKRFEQSIQEANRMKSEFLANMSHELRTPLNCIIGFAEFMVDGKPGGMNPKQKEFLEDILSSGRHLLHLINDVLDLAKVEAGRMELNLEAFSLRSAIEEVCAVARQMAQKKNIKVTLELEPGLDRVMLDQQKLKQVLYNLLSNAVKFTDDGGTVDIRGSQLNGHGFELAVVDTGIGIRSEDLCRLFREFEQLESDSTRRYGGTGLGLALTRKLLALQGGTIGVESELGKGSVFTLTLPLAAKAVLP